MIDQLNDLFNKIQNRLVEAFDLVADEALGLTLLMMVNRKKALSRNGLTAEWRKDDARRMAQHFYWLAKTYERIGQDGRAICFKRASSVIYKAIRKNEGFTGKDFLTHEHVGKKVRLEAYQVWLKDGYTERVQGLIDDGMIDPEYPAPMTTWEG